MSFNASFGRPGTIIARAISALKGMQVRSLQEFDVLSCEIGSYSSARAANTRPLSAL